MLCRVSRLVTTGSLAVRAAGIGFQLAWLALVLSGSAQEPAAGGGDYLLRRYEIEDGLPDNTITAVLQTHDGYLWIGTPRGLARFDGARFVVFSAANTPALAGDRARFLTEDSAGALWIAVDRGGIVRHRDGGFETMSPPTDSPAEWPTSLVADARGGVWAGLPDLRAKCWRVGHWTQFGEAHGLAGRGGVNCFADSSRRIWFTTETSYGFFDGERFAALATDVPLPQVMPCRQGGYWLARANVLGRFDQRGETLLMGRPPWRGGAAEIQAILEDRGGVLWIGTKGQGLYRFDEVGVERVRTTHDFITALHIDREGNLWVGSLGGGLDRLRPRPVRVHDRHTGLPDDRVHALCQSNDGALWLATRAAGPVRLADGRHTLFTASNGWPGGIVTTLCADHAGGVWFGTLTEGLVRWRAGAFNHEGLKGEHIESVFQDSHRLLWITTRRSGLIQWRDGKTTRIATNDVPVEVTALAEDGAGRLWAGTRGGTLHCFDGAAWQLFGSEAGLPATAIQVIHACGPGHLWLGTGGAGLVRFKDGRAKSITTRHGLPDDDIRQILADAGVLWFGSARGLFRAARSQIEEAADGRRGTVDCISYDRNDGLGIVEFTEGPANTACRADDGRLWFATRRGAVEVDPALPLPQPVTPLVLIEQLLADGRPIRGAVVPPLARVIEFRYTSPSFISPEKVRFRHRLRVGGGRADWVEAGTERAATFLNPPPGRYRFEVTATDAVGQWSDATQSLEFVIRPAFWQTLWFRAAAVVGVLTLAAIAIRIVVMHRVRRRLRLLEQQLALDRERARIAKDMHDHLGANLTRIALLSEQARGDADVSPQAAARAEKISRAARDVSQTLDEIVWAMNPGNDTLERLVGYLSEFAGEYLGATGIELQQDLPESVPNAVLRSDVRSHVFLAAKEALHNAVRHAAASKIELRVSVEPDCLRVLIADNGKGFSPDQRATAGNGLASMRQRLTAVGGDCRIESRPGAGTRVTLALPLPAAPAGA
jgi:signal transduction histidine kinase/ligand-binding sensor domain-containing protein